MTKTLSPFAKLWFSLVCNIATLSLSDVIVKFSLRDVVDITFALDVSDNTLLLIIKSSVAKISPVTTLIFNEFCLNVPSSTKAVPNITPSLSLINDIVDPLV